MYTWKYVPLLRCKKIFNKKVKQVYTYLYIYIYIWVSLFARIQMQK